MVKDRKFFVSVKGISVEVAKKHTRRDPFRPRLEYTCRIPELDMMVFCTRRQDIIPAVLRLLEE